MRSLKESILSSNGVDIISAIKDIILSDATPQKASRLNELWKVLKLDLSDFEWTYDKSTKHYAYSYTKEGNFIDRDFLAAGKHCVGNILVSINIPGIGMTKKLSKIYKDHLVKTLNLIEVASSEYWYHLNFK